MALPVTITGLAITVGCASQPFISSGGNVYIIGVDSGDANNVRAFKATDPTSSFSNVGTDIALGSANPITFLQAVQVSDVIHVVTYATSGTSSTVRYHSFNMASDSWSVTDETIQDITDSSASRTSGVAIGVRSDGDVIVLYSGNSDNVMGSARGRVDYARREGGSWTAGIAVDNAGATDWSTMGLVAGASDRMHFFFIDRDTPAAYQRTLTSANALETFPSSFSSDVNSAQLRNHNLGASYVSASTTKVRYPFASADGADRNSAKLDSADAPTVTVDTDITGATTLPNTSSANKCSFSADGTDLWHIYISTPTNDLYTQSNADGGGWGSTSLAENDASAILSIKSNIYTRGSDVVLAYYYTISGAFKYNEEVLSSGGSAWSSAATATATFTGASTFSSSLSASALASVTWTGNGLYPAAYDFDAIASVTWTGVEIQAATEADWESAAAASVTWGGTGLYPAALDSDAAASVTFNGIATAAGDWSSAAAASVTFNGISDATSAWSAAAVATLAFDTREFHSTDWSAAATASVTWTGAQLTIAAGNWFSTANFAAGQGTSDPWIGASTAASDWAAAATAALTMTGAATTASAWNAAATANLAAAGASLADANWNSQAAAILTLNGAEVMPAAWSSQATASLTWDGAEVALTGSDWSAASAASVTWGSVTIASAYIDTDVDAFATLRMTGGSVRSADWNAVAAASASFVGVESGETASFDISATANVTFGGADATVPTGLSAIDRDGWRKERQRLDKLEELDEEDILFMLTAAINYMETCRVND